MNQNEQLEYAIDKHVGKRIKHRRIVLGLSRNDLGEAIKVSVQQVHKYESAVNRVSSSKLYNIALFLKVPVNYFFEQIEFEMVGDPGIVSSSTLAEGYENDILEKDIVKLIKAYKKVNSSEVRMKILELIDIMSIKKDFSIKK